MKQINGTKKEENMLKQVLFATMKKITQCNGIVTAQQQHQQKVTTA